MYQLLNYHGDPKLLRYLLPALPCAPVPHCQGAEPQVGKELTQPENPESRDRTRIKPLVEPQEEKNTHNRPDLGNCFQL